MPTLEELKVGSLMIMATVSVLYLLTKIWTMQDSSSFLSHLRASMERMFNFHSQAEDYDRRVRKLEETQRLQIESMKLQIRAVEAQADKWRHMRVVEAMGKKRGRPSKKEDV